MERFKTTDAVLALIFIVSLWMLHEGHALELGLKQLSPIIDMLASSDEENLTFEELLSKKLNDSSIPEEYKDDAARLLKVLGEHGYTVDVTTVPNVEESYNTAFNSVSIEFQGVENRSNALFAFEVQVTNATVVDGKTTLTFKILVDENRVEDMSSSSLAIAAAICTTEIQTYAQIAQEMVDTGQAADVSTRMVGEDVAQQVGFRLFLTEYIMWQSGELSDDMIDPEMLGIFETMHREALLISDNTGSRGSTGLPIAFFAYGSEGDFIQAREYYLSLFQEGDGQSQ